MGAFFTGAGEILTGGDSFFTSPLYSGIRIKTFHPAK
jgi:hypothetical protein